MYKTINQGSTGFTFFPPFCFSLGAGDRGSGGKVGGEGVNEQTAIYRHVGTDVEISTEK